MGEHYITMHASPVLGHLGASTVSMASLVTITKAKGAPGADVAEQGLVAVPEQALAAGLQGGHAAAGLVVQQPQQLAPAQTVAVGLVHHAVQGRQQHLHRPLFCSQLGTTRLADSGRQAPRGASCTPCIRRLVDMNHICCILVHTWTCRFLFAKMRSLQQHLH